MVFKNSDIARILIGVPQGHKHLRTIIETNEGERLILQEATIAGLVRAYTTIKTHPRRRALELKKQKLNDKKPEFAAFQLLETGLKDAIIEKELKELLDHTGEARE